MATLFLASLLPVTFGLLLAVVVVCSSMLMGMSTNDARAGPEDTDSGNLNISTGTCGSASRHSRQMTFGMNKWRQYTALGGLGRLWQRSSLSRLSSITAFSIWPHRDQNGRNQKPQVFPAPPRASPVPQGRVAMTVSALSLRDWLSNLCQTARVTLHAREPTLAGCH